MFKTQFSRHSNWQLPIEVLLEARTGGLPHDTGGFSRKQIGCKVKESESERAGDRITTFWKVKNV